MSALINLIFFLIVAVTLGGSIWLSRKFKERYAEFPWWKTGVLLVIEIVAWFVCLRLWDMVRHNWWLVPVVVVIVLVILMKRKKRA